MAKSTKVYQLKVTLHGSRPPIWRRFKVPANVTLLRLHAILQAVMGWTDSHLHDFRVGGVHYGKPDPEFHPVRRDERRTRLDEVLRNQRDRIVYEYDFGDGWQHDIVLEDVLEPVPREKYPVVVAGKRACPPEDVGGLWGYYHFLEVLKDPKDPDHSDFVEWCGGSFDADAFDVQAINRAFHGGWGPPE